ncbi:hypothetical protein [Pseudoalteromonas denitrificans]|uniref:Uncharacterized protein n=1 Tax=Pseudoalteromonas denitrificans DSM 6059 TaxID=1123010 RepID=A0A1I1LX95_9GAMM|nr:hypothetical protein [Pseudoalteromonas denitrificans]SFC77721.1 hypothetical protein SAMN02745724_02508 [Pseudoalteromonas denitrificans DSM 6059]
MNNKAKKILLARKFTSIEYMSEYVQYFNEMVDALIVGMSEFKHLYQQNPTLDPDNFEDWENRGLPNLQRGAKNAKECLERAKNGSLTGISSSAGNLRGLSKDVDNIGGFGQWWQHIDKKFADAFDSALNKAQITGNNIDYTISGYWDNDEILDEEITGTIDEDELLNYLKTSEKIKDIS